MTSLEQHLAMHQMTPGYPWSKGDWRVACECGWRGEPVQVDTARAEHAAHVAATWREARTVRTVEELDALPKGTLVSSRGIICRNRGWASLWQMIMHTKSGNAATPLDLDPDDIIPALIVWTPEDGAL